MLCAQLPYPTERESSSNASQNHFGCGSSSLADEFRDDEMGDGADQGLNPKSEEVSLAAMVHEWHEW